MIIPFTYYLHDRYTRSEFQEVVLEDQLGLGYDEDDNEVDLEPLMQKIGRPFYEVKLDCTLDTETGAVVILKTTP